MTVCILQEVFVGLLSLPLVREVAQSFDGNPEEIFCIFNSIRYVSVCWKDLTLMWI